MRFQSIRTSLYLILAQVAAAISKNCAVLTPEKRETRISPMLRLDNTNASLDRAVILRQELSSRFADSFEYVTARLSPMTNISASAKYIGVRCLLGQARGLLCSSVVGEAF